MEAEECKLFIRVLKIINHHKVRETFHFYSVHGKSVLKSYYRNDSGLKNLINLKAKSTVLYRYTYNVTLSVIVFSAWKSVGVRPVSRVRKLLSFLFRGVQTSSG